MPALAILAASVVVAWLLSYPLTWVVLRLMYLVTPRERKAEFRKVVWGKP